MNQVRELVIYRNHFYDFYDKQTEKAKEKIDYVLFLVTHIDNVPVKFLKNIEGQKGLYEIRVEHNSNIFRIFCCFDKGKIIVLFNGYQKKTNKTLLKEIVMANKLMKEYFSSTK